jgi:hypothetical protein
VSGRRKRVTREEAILLIARLLPKVWLESRFLNPGMSIFHRSHIPASVVFDAIRDASEPPISPEEFNDIADGIQNGVKDASPRM